MVGQTLLHYRITDRLGAGGMGEVHRATDTKLGREVAIKLLPSEVASDPARLTRFRREAQLLSLLNHPNIAAIYGLEEVDGRPFLVLELVEGEDLSQRLARGPIPVDEALEIAVQVAEAVEEAHRKEIVHRDLKPANVKLTPEGKVKVLDFGLAKAWGGTGAGSAPSALSESPTLTRTGTMAGVVLGTAAYMSPEQARGKAVDRRADVWSFGVLLWEMLMGRRLFTGETVADVIAAVMTQQPDLGALPEATPQAARRLIERCLRKDPRTRLPDIGAARLELQDLRRGGAAEDSAGPVARRAAKSSRMRVIERLIWTGLVLAAAGLTGALGRVRATEPSAAAPPVASFTVDPPDGWAFSTDWLALAPSPGDTQVVFRATETDPARSRSMLWTRPLGSPTLRPLLGTEGVLAGGFWSPDRRHMAYFAPGELRRLALADGSTLRVSSLPVEGPGAGDWNEDGTILFSAGGDRGRIYSVPSAGGEAKLALSPDASQGELLVHGPQVLPGGRHFLFFVGGRREELTGTYVAPLAAPTRKRLVLQGIARAQYSAGRLLFVRDGTLLAQPFEPRSAELTGEPVAIASNVGFWRAVPTWGWFGASQTGVLAYFSGRTVASHSQLTWLDRRGSRLGTVGEPANYGQLALSPDGRHIAIEAWDDSGQSDLWVMDLRRGVSSRVTTRPGDDDDPVWSPDGRSLAFAARGVEKGMLRRKGLRAADPEIPLTDLPDEDHPEYWSRDGGTVLFVRRTPEDAQSVWALRLATGKVEPVLDARFRPDEPHLSPDERWLAYVSRESGRDEVYVEPFRRQGERLRVSVEGGGQPQWRRDGRELFYVSSRNEVMAVGVRASGNGLGVGLPTALFVVQGVQGTGYDNYAPSGDGQRFLVKVPVGSEQSSRLHIVTHWPSLLK